MTSGFTWTQHVEHGGYFRCPDDALGEMSQRGWQPSDPPEMPNPATAEHLAWRAAQDEAGPRTPTTRAAARGTVKEV